MGFSKDIYNEAKRRIAARKAAAEDDADQRRLTFYAQCPEYEQLTSELSRTGARLAMAIFKHGDIAEEVEQIRAYNLELQQKMSELLQERGLEKDFLDPKYCCAQCRDTGIGDTKLCDCMQKMMRDIAIERLNAVTPLELSTFESFSLMHYPDTAEQGKGMSVRKLMEITLEKCRTYAENFSLESPSLLFQGGVGLGKTHLSLAIARVVINKGFGVVYGSVNNLFCKIEKEHFNRAESSEDTRALLKECDLLILDDLGSEFVTQFTVSVLYDIINTRLLCGKPTIISTNLSPDGLEQKYSERVMSRITGNYRRYPFSGSDMRIVLRKAKKSTDK